MSILHHTKTKGDLGVLKAQVDLAEKGYLIAVPLTEHAPFDIVAYKDGVFKRIQVKYRAVKNGCIPVCMRSTYSTSHGTKTVKANREEIDIICVYCPDTDLCYYLSFDEVGVSDTVVLRVSVPKNGQKSGIRLAEDHLGVP